MIELKRLFYVKFCTQAVQEGNIPPDMKPFIEYIATKLGNQQWSYVVKTILKFCFVDRPKLNTLN